MNISKKAIDDLIGRGELSEAIDQLLQFAEQTNSKFKNAIILQSSQLSNLEQSEMDGVVSSEHAFITRNKITASLLAISKKLEKDFTVVQSNTNNQHSVGQDKTILFVAANPKDTDSLRLGEEFSKISNSIRLSQGKNKLRIEQEWASGVANLRRAMLQHNPSFVHFSGHGSNSGGIVLEDVEGYSMPIDITALGNFFSAFEETLECILLVSCFSEPQAKEIVNHIPFVIGTKDKIPDDTSIAFSEAFYDAIGAGRTIEQSFSIACNNISLSGLDGHDLPVLLKK